MPMQSVWRKACDLIGGDRIATANSCGAIKEIYPITGTNLIYDITVQEHHTFLVSSEKIVAHNVVMFLPFVLGGGISLAQSVTLANVGAAMFTLAVCAIAEKITGKSLNAEIGADGTYNGVSLPFTQEYRTHHNYENDRADFIVSSSGGGSGGQCECRCGCPCVQGHTCNCFCGCRTNNGRNVNKNYKRQQNGKDRISHDIKRSQFFNEVRGEYQAIGDTGYYRLRDHAQGIVKDAFYLNWDRCHSEVEVYDRNGNHIGALDPKTKKIYKQAVKNRKIPKNIR